MVLVHCTSPHVTYLCMKFEVTSFNTFEVMSWTRFCDRRMDRRTGWTDGQGDSSIPPRTKFGGILEFEGV